MPKHIFWTIISFSILYLVGVSILVATALINQQNVVSQNIEAIPAVATPTPQLITLPPIPASKFIANDYHIFQTFNNCGPAALSMGLSYFDINVSQQVLGQALRPYQNPQGIDDDKSTTLEEMAIKAEEYGLVAYHRPAGNIEILTQFIANDIPVITRTWTKVNEDIGHYRVVKGYDNTSGEIIQDDSLQNKNLRFSYADFNRMWEKFNYEYLVLVPEEKQEIATAILGENIDIEKAWENAQKMSENMLSKNSNDTYARFNLSVALFYTGEYQKSIEEFEKVETSLPFRTLWYQIEPIQAYYEVGNYARVFEITDRILENGNRAFSELYLIRGQIYLDQGSREAARQEFEKAVLYNRNLKEAKEALESI